ncbi:chaperone protein dnaJ-like protein [Parasponia andersonii]|uniref:Chaperone protein dnaJ-like protein n=1 Tax=Parasponia andersonii TaxID=3476 RepID=A0A2P5DT29_PARAD|nr:chaperone protein dnaJ-like protein [Parasponia andersonii]
MANLTTTMIPSMFKTSRITPSSPSTTCRFLKPLRCTPVQQVPQQAEAGILCEPCNGKGWLLCEFCKGQKSNVKAENNRIYRRCPSCRAVGYVLCSSCKVYKCVTFPNYTDGDELSF